MPIEKLMASGCDETETIYYKPGLTVIDGCAILWVIHWPSNGVVKDFVNGFIKFIFEKLSISNLYLVFDRYYDFSIKSGTRKGRAGSLAARHHKIRLDTPLPSQKAILNVTENKSQLTDIICEQLLDEVKLHQASNTSNHYHKLVITGSKSIPQKINMGVIIPHRDLRTTHEEADVTSSYCCHARNWKHLSYL